MLTSFFDSVVLKDGCPMYVLLFFHAQKPFDGYLCPGSRNSDHDESVHRNIFLSITLYQINAFSNVMLFLWGLLP
jgi:hypothetical protein